MKLRMELTISNVVKVLLERKGSSVTTLLSIYNYTSRIPLFLCK